MKGIIGEENGRLFFGLIKTPTGDVALGHYNRVKIYAEGIFRFGML